MQVLSLYQRRGFKVATVHGDGEFEPLKPMIEASPNSPTVNLTSRDEHVPEIERRIRVVKERARAVRHSLPFEQLPKLMTTHLVLHVVRQLTYFPSKAGISDLLSPRMLIKGEALDYKKDLALQYGEYCQVHEHDTPRNSEKARTKAAICMGPTGNKQGGYRFMSIRSGKKITRYSYDRVPMPDTVIARVNELGKDQPKHLTFLDRKGRVIGDVEPPGVDSDDAPVDTLPKIDDATVHTLDDDMTSHPPMNLSTNPTQ